MRVRNAVAAVELKNKVAQVRKYLKCWQLLNPVQNLRPKLVFLKMK